MTSIVIGALAALYLLVPIALMAFGSVRAVILSPIREIDWADHSRWKRPTFTAIIFVSAMVAWPLFLRGRSSSRERNRPAIMDRREWRPDGEYRIDEIQPQTNLTLPGRDSALNKCVPTYKTGLVSDLGSYAKRGEFFLTTQISGAEAEQIREKMKSWSRLVTGYSQIWYDPPEKLDPPVYFEPMPTDEVWRYTTSGRSWKNLAGRAGCALVRDGVVICNTV